MKQASPLAALLVGHTSTLLKASCDCHLAILLSNCLDEINGHSCLIILWPQPAAAATPLCGYLTCFCRCAGPNFILPLTCMSACMHRFQYTMLAWLPSYFTQTQGTDLLHAGSIAMVPNLASMFASYAAGWSADALLARGFEVSHVRKLAQAIAFLGPVACLAGVVNNPQGDHAVPLIIAAMGLSSFSVAGLYCNHSDLSPKHASTLLGLTNTAGTLPGIVGVALTGYLLDQTHDWNIALFMPSIAFFCSGAVVFSLFGSTEYVDLEGPQLNAPFAWEAWMPWGSAAKDSSSPRKQERK